jgi:hypothetical protein
LENVKQHLNSTDTNRFPKKTSPSRPEIANKKKEQGQSLESGF